MGKSLTTGQKGVLVWRGVGVRRRAWGWGVHGVHLAKGHPAQSSTKLGHEKTLHLEVGVGQGHRGRRWGQVCGGVGVGVHLITDQLDPKADHMSS